MKKIKFKKAHSSAEVAVMYQDGDDFMFLTMYLSTIRTKGLSIFGDFNEEVLNEVDKIYINYKSNET